MLCHGRRTAAITQHHSHVCQIQIAHQRLIMSFQRLKSPVIAVPGCRQQRGFHVFALDGTVERTETVDHGLQLGRHSVIVQRCDKHQHVGGKDRFADGLHVILLYAGPLVSAVNAACTGMDICPGCIHDLHAVTSLLRTLPEALRQQIGGTFFVGTSL